MEKKNLIGKKVRGFKFTTSSELAYTSSMDGYEECAGEIIGVNEVSVKVQFEDGRYYWYPLDQIEQHLVKDELPSQYEVGMTVYHYSYGRGKVTDINKDKFHCVGVMFPSVGSVRFMADGRVGSSLSLTPYDLVNGGATFPTFKPKVPEIEKGTLVYVRDDRDRYWGMRFFSHFDDEGVCYCFGGQKKEGEVLPWPEYSLTNPLIEKQ